ncbi:MAG: LamG domain-containing protein, partial [Phycisphaeraceae bacterium]|nr:LamG domain-containing protein [Phycisphaeraceae bacterium]
VWLHSYKNTTTRSRTPLSIGRWVRYRHLGPRKIRLEVEDQGGPPHGDLIVELQHATNGKTRIWARKRSSHAIPSFTHELLDQNNLSLFGEIKGQGQRWVIKTPQPDPARMVDVTLVQGPTSQSTAVQFEQSRSRVDVPLVRTTVTSLTLAAWMRYEPNGKVQPLLGPQSALQFNDWTWQVEPDHHLSVRLHTPGGMKTYRSSKPLPVREWVYVSVVIDADHRQVVHLLNGDPINTLTTHAAIAEAKIGPMRIGRDTQNNRFAGEIDEMALWVRSVSYDQLLQLYERSRPSYLRP